MNDGESRSHLLALCNTLRDHLKQTEKLTSAIEMLQAGNPALRARYDAEHNKQRDAEAQTDDESMSIAGILLRLEEEIQTLEHCRWLGYLPHHSPWASLSIRKELGKRSLQSLCVLTV